MTNRTNMIVTAVIAAVFTFTGLKAGISGMMAGWSIIYLPSALILPIILWVLTFHYYKEYQKDKNL